ncbi:MAG: precorrin-2 C(20)-methyltransferase, partial [Hyphomicrobiales bacterium]|nr:precorrin-2 C(20)-methyltransferase [Hyphomicrobiales bacterium]
GDPELLTVAAVRAIEAAPVVAWFAKAGRRGHARTVADVWMKPCVEIALDYPLTTEIAFDDSRYRSALRAFYDASSLALDAHIDAGRDVALLCEGDPMFYGSFMHVFERLAPRRPVKVIPGITGMSGCWSAALAPMTWGDDALVVLPGTLPEDALARRLREADAAVVMKIGRNFDKVRRAIEEAGLTDRAIYVERGTQGAQRIVPMAEAGGVAAPYFSLVLVPGRGRRP